MALVAYEYSDSSDVESDNEDDKQTDKPSVVELIPQTNGHQNNEDNPTSALFSSLPKPKQHPANEIIEEEEDEIILKHKNKPPVAATKTKVKITIPSLNSYHSDEEDAAPKKIIHKAPEKASGLFAILPSPKCPAPEKRKFDASVVKQKNLVPRTVKANQQKKAAKRAIESDDEDTPSDGNFFSSIFTDSKIDAAPAVPASNVLNIQVDSAQPVRDINTKSNNYFANLVAEATKKPEPEPEEPEEDFEEKAVKELVGKKKQKRMKGNVKMVDINATDIMPDPRDWRTKALTEEDNTPAVKKGEEPSVQSKRKHQITYLAYQAKVNEQELKNQWALNRMTRKQTQAKYGF